MTYDVIIIGGSYSGLAAALQVARARRKVLVVDAGERRNRFAESSHGFLTQDGTPAAQIARVGREQLLAYPNVTWIDARAENVQGALDAFTVRISSGMSYEGQRLILATGVTDILPTIPGLRERWGKSVFHCPYCHGYELGTGPIGVLATSALSTHQAAMLADWGNTTLFVNGMFEPDSDQINALTGRGVRIEYAAIVSIAGKDTRPIVEVADGRAISLAGLFTLSRTAVTGPLPQQLGCAMEDGLLGTYIKTEDTKLTSVPGVYACGDTALMAGSVSFAVGDGVRAGVSAHQSLIFSSPAH
ncbi:NAD(P)/FAD-dependent oxidoreductase [Phyllobacterium sp. YR531]|uniref:NAD(P)/FAD-dependent oxidoreductase n=1 Tax=Phyllobacterium sp. YR531 TaxID=1144343 RepID=UPI00026F6422|nr:NAD(P)/FAD-dependent oxidoreductase [Phyllobacterium sp. YR531]EJN02759.1 thioredoxin reductase [Phyllobacterium sp. YR531]